MADSAEYDDIRNADTETFTSTDSLTSVKTVLMTPEEFDKHPEPESNNDPETQIRSANLQIDSMVTDRLTRKPPDKYRFRKSIGRGGMKMVLQVRDMDSTRDVAMAILPDAAARPKRDILRFVQEARLTASLEHPNIVPVHDIGVDPNGAPYFTMKLIHGENLGSLLSKLADHEKDYLEKYDLNRLLRIFLKICSGMAFAHSKGVIHLDLKPDNIQIGDFGEVLIMDWGLAKVIGSYEDENEEPGTSSQKESSVNSTLNGVTKGTPGYMAPEQAAGKNNQKDVRTDIYALGAILYAILTLKSPISQGKLQRMISDTVDGKIISPRDRVPEREIPAALEAVVMKAMSLKPEDRYQSVVEIRDEVRAFIGGYATEAEKASMAKKTFLLLRRHTILSASTAIILFLLTAFSVYAIQEQCRKIAAWDPVIMLDFENMTHEELPKDLLFVQEDHNGPVEPWRKTAYGLLMQKNEWLYCYSDLEDTMRLELAFVPLTNHDTLEIDLSNVNPDSGRIGNEGYRVLIGDQKGLTNSVSLHRADGSKLLLARSAATIRANRENRLELIWKDSIFSVYANENLLMSCYHKQSSRYNHLSVRSISPKMQLCRLNIFSRTIPEKPSPLLAGDILVENQMYEKAIRKYLRIADSTSLANLCDEALLKAYKTAADIEEPYYQKRRRLLEIKRRIVRRPDFLYMTEVRKIDAVFLWKMGNYAEAMRILDFVMKKSKGDPVALDILMLRQKRVPQEYIAKLLCHVGSIPDITSLDVSGLEITSLVPLRSLPLTYLNCSDNRLTSLEGIEKMPLRVLIADRNRIDNIEALRYHWKLRWFSAVDNKINNPAPLQSLKLERLDMEDNPIMSGCTKGR